MYELDKVITDAEKEELVDTIIIKTQRLCKWKYQEWGQEPC